MKEMSASPPPERLPDSTGSQPPGTAEHQVNGETPHQNIYSFSPNSASELLKTIIIASQANNQSGEPKQANVQNAASDFAKNSSSSSGLLSKIISSQAVALTQQSNKQSTTEEMERQKCYNTTLPTDLQNFNSSEFFSTNDYSNSQSMNTQQSQQHDQQQTPQQRHHQQQQQQNYNSQNERNMLGFNGMTHGLGIMPDNQISRTLNESNSRSATEDNNVHKQQQQSESYSLQSFETFGCPSQHSPEMGRNKSQVLHQLLSAQGPQAEKQHHTTYSTSSPEFPKGSPVSSSSSPYTDSNMSPFEMTQSSNIMEIDTQHQYQEMSHLKYPDTTTQSTLINGTDRLRLDSFSTESGLDTDIKPKLEWTDGEHGGGAGTAHDTKSGKVARMHQDSDASSALSPSVDRVFNPDEAQQEVPKEFTFTVFGQTQKVEESPLDILPFGQENILTSDDNAPGLPSVVDNSPFKTPTSMAHSQVKKHRDSIRRQKEPILCQTFPSKLHGYELRILEQPEEQHRARYLTEGSRGAVKSRSGIGYPIVKLFGYKGEATLQVFIGNDVGKVRPHGFYQACKVCGKNSTACSEKDIDGTTVIEITLQPNDMTATIDCVGILKLRNADVEQRIGIAKAKKRSTKARMIFRVTFQKPCGSPQVLQVAGSSILCTQPIGQPEICKMSLKECSASGGEEMFIIGKNFLRGTRVFFQQVNEETASVIWEKEGEIDKDYFQATHLIASVPGYDGDLQGGGSNHHPFHVVVHSGGKVSDPQQITYRPEDLVLGPVKQDMDTLTASGATAGQGAPVTPEETGRKRNYPFVAPEALELNQQIQQSQQQSSNSNSSDMFQLPPGIITGVMSPPLGDTAPDSFTPMEESSSTIPTGAGSFPSTPTQQLQTQKNFVTEVEPAALRKGSFSMNQNNFGPESLDTVHTQTLDSKANVLFNAAAADDNDKNTISASDLDLNDVTFSGNSADDYVNSDHQMETSYNQLKSNEQFATNSFDLPSIPTSTQSDDPNIVSQFLQNLAMKTSDPMLCGNNTVMSMRVLHQNDTIMTPANNNIVMSPDAKQVKPSTGNSLLKEVLTCPQSSLEGFGAFQFQNTVSNSSSQFTPKVEPGVMDIDAQMDSLKTMLQDEADKQQQSQHSITPNVNVASQLNFPSNLAVKDSPSTMEYSTTNVDLPGQGQSQVNDTIDLTSNNTIDLTGDASTPAPDTPFSPEQTVPSGQTEMPFSPSDLLSNFQMDQPMPELKTVVSTVAEVTQYSAQPLLTSTVNNLGTIHQHNPVTMSVVQPPPQPASLTSIPAVTSVLGMVSTSEGAYVLPSLSPVQTAAQGAQGQVPGAVGSSSALQVATGSTGNTWLHNFLTQVASQGLSQAQQQVIQDHVQQQQQEQQQSPNQSQQTPAPECQQTILQQQQQPSPEHQQIQEQLQCQTSLEHSQPHQQLMLQQQNTEAQQHLQQQMLQEHQLPQQPQLSPQLQVQAQQQAQVHAQQEVQAQQQLSPQQQAQVQAHAQQQVQAHAQQQVQAQQQLSPQQHQAVQQQQVQVQQAQTTQQIEQQLQAVVQQVQQQQVQQQQQAQAQQAQVEQQFQAQQVQVQQVGQQQPQVQQQHPLAQIVQQAQVGQQTQLQAVPGTPTEGQSFVPPQVLGVSSPLASPAPPQSPLRLNTSLATPSSTPVAPQIIICNNPTAAQGLPNPVAQNQFSGAPSIVIMPGQGGANNQMESLLRSILGSMMQPSATQPQPPQPPQ